MTAEINIEVLNAAHDAGYTVCMKAMSRVDGEKSYVYVKPGADLSRTFNCFDANAGGLVFIHAHQWELEPLCA
jgi:hypothetical protein